MHAATAAVRSRSTAARDPGEPPRRRQPMTQERDYPQHDRAEMTSPMVNGAAFASGTKVRASAA